MPLAGLLADVPPADLKIIELAAELTLPGGGLDLDAAAARQPEVELACAQAQDYAAATNRLLGGAEMATAAPPVLSNLAETLLRRPPSLRELVVRLGYAEDYAWFSGLSRRLFPDEAEAMLAIPDLGQRLERFARLFEERHFTLIRLPTWNSSWTRVRTRPSPGSGGASPSS